MLEQDFTHEWQQDVSKQLKETAVILERLSGRIDGIDQRVRAQENANTPTPASRAAWSQAWAGWAAMAVALLALLVAAGAHVSFH